MVMRRWRWREPGQQRLDTHEYYLYLYRMPMQPPHSEPLLGAVFVGYILVHAVHVACVGDSGAIGAIRTVTAIFAVNHVGTVHDADAARACRTLSGVHRQRTVEQHTVTRVGTVLTIDHVGAILVSVGVGWHLGRRWGMMNDIQS